MKIVHKQLTLIMKNKFAKAVLYNFLYGMVNIVLLALKIHTTIKKPKNASNVRKDINSAEMEANAFLV